MKYLLMLSMLLSALSMGCPAGEPCKSDGPYEVSDRTQGMVQQFEYDIRSGKLGERTNEALDAMIRFAAFKLRQKGYKTKAKQLLKEWENNWNGYLTRRDLGDHAPMSQWLAEKTAMLELVLGIELMKMTRLYDLVIINYALPVVFRCIDHVDEVEFGKHFIPLAGVVIYWGSFFTCVGFTWGTGFLFCGPISMGCEFLTVNILAPRLNAPVWKLSCKPTDGLVLPEFIPQEAQGGFVETYD